MACSPTTQSGRHLDLGTGFNVLPVEIICEVTSLLTVKDLLTCERLSKDWRDLANRDVVWKRWGAKLMVGDVNIKTSIMAIAVQHRGIVQATAHLFSTKITFSKSLEALTQEYNELNARMARNGLTFRRGQSITDQRAIIQAISTQQEQLSLLALGFSSRLFFCELTGKSLLEFEALSEHYRTLDKSLGKKCYKAMGITYLKIGNFIKGVHFIHLHNQTRVHPDIDPAENDQCLTEALQLLALNSQESVALPLWDRFASEQSKQRACTLISETSASKKQRRK